MSRLGHLTRSTALRSALVSWRQTRMRTSAAAVGLETVGLSTSFGSALTGTGSSAGASAARYSVLASALVSGGAATASGALPVVVSPAVGGSAAIGAPDG